MPVRGLTGQPAEFPEIGQLRKGNPKTKEGHVGRDLTYFRFTSDVPDVEAAFHAAYNDEPRLINCFLPFASVGECWEAWQEEYVAGGLVHRCDGETMVVWLDEDGSYSTDPLPCPYASGAKKRTKDVPGCKPTGRLKIVIPELQRLAYVTVITNSTNDIRNLDRQLRALQTVRLDLRGVPMQLRRTPDRISTPGANGKRVRRESWLLSIEAAPSWVSLQLAAQEAAAIPQLPGSTVRESAPVIDAMTGEITDGDWDEDMFDANHADEQEEPPPDFLVVQVPKGEYAGKTIGWLLENDRSYLDIISTNARDREVREAAQAALQWADEIQERLF